MTATYKILIFLKRRPGMPVEEFRRYYEEVHAPLAQRHSRGPTRYLRRYLDPLPDPETGAAEELAYDAVTELWFEDEATFRATLEAMATRPMPAAIVEDEKKLFDRARTRIATVVERESDPASRPAG